MIKIIECPRDAMQGIREFIDTEDKVLYINSLLKVGFDTLDCGSFVSAKAIPQMRDTTEVIRRLDLLHTNTKLLTIVANLRGAEEAVQFDEISFLGYPFSISETFQLRNTNATIEESLGRVADIQQLCERHEKKLVLYISMGFGNPYGDEWNVEIVQKWTEKMSQFGIKIISLSDTIGVSNPENIRYLFEHLIPAYPHIEIGAHLHTEPKSWRGKVEAAYQSGCRRFDSAMRGFGGCPMAKDDLTGNMATENILSYFDSEQLDLKLDRNAFFNSLKLADKIFPH